MIKAKQDKVYKDEEIQAMVASLRGGDKSMIVQLIKAHFDLVNRIANKYAWHTRLRRDDIYGTAYLALADAVNTFPQEGDIKITNYIAMKVKGRIRHFLCADFLIPIPEDEFRKRIKMDTADPKDFDDMMELPVHASGVIPGAWAVILPLNNARLGDRERDIPYVDMRFESVEDLFNQMGLTEREVRVCNMRLDGYTLEEIGGYLELSKMMVSYIINDIKAKINRLGIKTPERTRLISGTKCCSKCQQDKSLSFFYKIGPDSYKSVCKPCMKEAYAAKTASIH